MQEISLLCIEAENKRIYGAGYRKCFGNGRDRIGVKCFSRAVTSRLHDMRRRYGLYRNKSFYPLDNPKYQ
jgi:hypothetical protein